MAKFRKKPVVIEVMCKHVFEFIKNNQDEAILVCNGCGMKQTIEETVNKSTKRLELLRRCAIKLDDISKGYSNLVELDILPKQHHPTAQMIILDIEELQRKLTKELADETR